ncbi:type VI secretion system ATPase TssH [Niveibacterium umoris]|uniref:Type VI secretion system protein VasG n=1 Tax=Niveibacterium umoris TaxID=1193620 RepID=A0A840BJH0_9RHOO|nr:type VI secretion system ATPase TssH [Niveibacterium umoris]MBB4012773.1 type VI secretion system protein VasG [Niveibacterium umoris]
MSTHLKVLIGKLNVTCRQAAERAAALCMSRGHYEVDIEHLFVALGEQVDSDFAVIAHRAGLSLQALLQDLEAELARLPSGNTRTPVFSERIPQLLEAAWLIASIDDAQARIRSAHLLHALLADHKLAQMAYRASKLFARFQVDGLKHELARLTAGSVEAPQAAATREVTIPDEGEGMAPAPANPSRTPALDQYTTNLTARAAEGKIDPVIGRDAEIRQAMDILLRRRQNNPILTGEAGVGKTAVVEGLALRIAQGDVPPPLVDVALHALDLGLLQAGASVKGEFENRLKCVIDEVKKSPRPIILFIDEAHTMIGAGGTAGQNDAANLLKPALARGELRTIAATTWSEYKKYFEKDAALARRFQVVKVEEPTPELACAMLRGMAPLMERHFGVRVLDEAITEAVMLSARYISGRQLPDKAIGVLDTACARVALAQNATPGPIDDLRKEIERLDAEIHGLVREGALGLLHASRRDELAKTRDSRVAELSALEAQWRHEVELVARIHALRADLADAASSNDPRHAELASLTDELARAQGESPLVPLQVDGRVAAEVIAAWTGIPLGRMVKDEIRAVLGLRDAMAERVIGQDHALEAIAQRVRTARANLEDPNKPKGVFLFVGPSGVGKTESAHALAEILYGGARSLVTINMSEYQEAHSVSGLKGSPPGYVGYGEGGVLTEAVRRQPYSVVLLDEVEKAHPDVLELFFQVFDKGVMDDAEGREVDFRNTIIILTSNVASATLMSACINKAAEEMPSPDALLDAIRPQLYKAFKPAFLGRLTVVPFYPISDDVLARIIRLKLDRIARRVAENHKAVFSHDEALVEAVLARCVEADSGARNVDNILSGSLLPEVSESVLARMAEGEAINKIKVGVSKKGAFTYKVS